jgi:hypothetical protein
MSTDSIINKWNKQGSFIRFIDGNKRNCHFSNLEYVGLKDTMLNFDVWTVDWDVNLTKKEIKMVNSKQWRDGLRFK